MSGIGNVLFCVYDKIEIYFFFLRGITCARREYDFYGKVRVSRIFLHQFFAYDDQAVFAFTIGKSYAFRSPVDIYNQLLSQLGIFIVRRKVEFYRDAICKRYIAGIYDVHFSLITRTGRDMLVCADAEYVGTVSRRKILCFVIDRFGRHARCRIGNVLYEFDALEPDFKRTCRKVVGDVRFVAEKRERTRYGNAYAEHKHKTCHKEFG